jgi:hypothetical protein
MAEATGRSARPDDGALPRTGERRTHPFPDDAERIDTWDVPKAIESAMVAAHFGALYLEMTSVQ